MVKTKEINLRGYAQQQELLESKEFEIALIAGIGAGKTHAGAQKMLKCQLENPGSSGIVTSPSYRIMDMATLPKYQQIYPPELIKKQKTRPYPQWELKTGGFIYFYSTDKPETIVGGEVAYVHMDEASLSPYLAYMNCKKRMRQRDVSGVPYPYQLWITTTPRQLNWIYLEFGEERKPSHLLIKASTKDNIYRDQTEIEEYINKLGLSGLEYSQEIEGNFEILAGDCLFKKEDLDRQLHRCDEPIEVRGAITIYHEYVPGERYVAAADCADEGKGGANDMVIQDPQTGKEMAEVYTEKSAGEFSELCFDLLGEYHNPVFAPERNGTVGGMVIEKFRGMGYPNLYKDLNGRDGWYTIPSTALPPAVGRFTMLKEYEEAVRTRQTVIQSSDAIGEMSTFVKNKNGRYEALPGRRDDRIMARAICWQLRKVKPITPIKFGSYKRYASTYI